jgi:YD repeat-containing protein
MDGPVRLDARPRPTAAPKWRQYLYRSLFLCFLVAFGIFIWSLYFPLHAPQLLPLPPAHPASDGSYPELLIRYGPAVSGGAPVDVSYARNSPTLTHDSPLNQFEVNLSTGKFVVRQTDLFEPGAIPLSLTRTYDSFDSMTRSFGVGTTQPYDVSPVGSRFPYTFMDLYLEDGESVHFERISKGTGFTDAIYEHRETSSKEFFGARIRWNVDEWNLSLPGGSTFVFPDAYYAKTLAQGAITEIRGASGERIKVSRNSSGDIKSVTSSSGHRMDFSYDDSDRIVAARDDLGDDRRYSYDSDGRLVSASDATSILVQFAYVSSLMTRIRDGSGKEILGIMYDGGRVTAVRLPSGERYGFTYDVDSSNHVTRALVSDPQGKTSAFDFR